MKKHQRRVKSSRRNQQARTPRPNKVPIESTSPSHLGSASKWAIGTGVALLGFIASVDQIWGPPWPTRPAFSPGVPSGSPFDVPFKVENKSAFFEFSNLTISCELLRFRAEGETGSVIQGTARIEARGTNRLAPLQSAPYTCPLRGIMRVGGSDAADKIIYAQVVFRSEYDAPLLWGRLQAESAVFTLNTSTAPPQWNEGRPLK
jgi:hypothetical protein